MIAGNEKVIMQALVQPNVTQSENKKVPRGLLTWNTTINLTLGKVAVVSSELTVTSGIQPLLVDLVVDVCGDDNHIRLLKK